MPSARFIKAMTDAETSECPCHLVTISRSDWPEPLRFTDAGANLLSGGQWFIARAMTVALPGDSADPGARRGRLTLDNVAQDVIARLRSAGGYPIVRVDVVLAAYPDDIEESWPNLELVDSAPNGQAIACELSPRDDTGEVWPTQTLGPEDFPGLYD